MALLHVQPQHLRALGSPTEMYDELGQLAWRMQLDAFGVGRADVALQHCPWRWPGQYEDEETDLLYNRFRYYDAYAGRYISQDPLGLAAGPSLYGYPEDPLSATDPLGLSECGKADPWKLNRTHEIGGNRSSKLVIEMAEAMNRNGFSGPPIDVVVHEGKMFVVDGHHRLAASKMAGLKEVPINVIDDIASHPSSWRSTQEAVQDAAAVSPNNLRHKGKRLPY